MNNGVWPLKLALEAKRIGSLDINMASGQSVVNVVGSNWRGGLYWRLGCHLVELVKKSSGLVGVERRTRLT